MSIKSSQQIDIEQARKQGEFQGQVLAKLSSLESAINAFTVQQSAFEGRVRALESDNSITKETVKQINSEFTHQINVNIPQILKDSDDTHKRLHVRMDALENARSGILGGLKVIHVLLSFGSGILASLITYFLTKGK